MIETRAEGASEKGRSAAAFSWQPPGGRIVVSGRIPNLRGRGRTHCIWSGPGQNPRKDRRGWKQLAVPSRVWALREIHNSQEKRNRCGIGGSRDCGRGEGIFPSASSIFSVVPLSRSGKQEQVVVRSTIAVARVGVQLKPAERAWLREALLSMVASSGR